ALERAHLVEVRADLEFLAGAARRFGAVRGEVVLDGRRFAIDAPGFADGTFAQGVPRGERRRLALSAAFGPDLAITAHVGEAKTRAEQIDAEGARAIAAELDELAASGGLDRVSIRLEDGRTLVAEPEGRMAILRPFGPTEFARISFGVARFALDDGRRGTGFYEYSEVYPP
ncbi:MAG: hypothetical protein ACREQJ_00040, partial [Candidatus Binatia bacterium]